jgi:glycosyltransferase involved in cell wall biosynthesis
MHFAVPIILANAGLLDTFFTDVHLGNKAWLYRLVNSIPQDSRPKMIRQLCGLTAAGIPPERIVSFDVFGLWYLMRRREQMSFGDVTELYAKVNRLFGDRVVRRGLGNSNAVWGFNGAALEIFKHAREKGITCILEQTIAPRTIEREFLLEEAGRWPEWQPGLDIDLSAGLDLLAEREEAEWELADRIICGSDFVLEGLKARGVPMRKCSVVPYGVEMDHLQPVPTVTSGKNLNVLFVGEIGLRKGVPYLLEALRAIDSPESVHAKLVGPVAIDRNCLARYDRWCEVVGPVPRSLMSELYDWADILVLPSICEGSATVTYEAMARSIPVITTPNSGSLVRDGVEGFIVPIRDHRAIQEKVELLRDDRGLWLSMANAATERAREASLEAYGKRLLEVFALGTN